MGKFILKLTDSNSGKDYYMEWSTIVDAPVTYGMELSEFREYYKDEYGTSGMDELEVRLERVKKNGVSAHPPYDVYEDYFNFNCASDEGETLDKEGILEKYCRCIRD